MRPGLAQKNRDLLASFDNKTFLQRVLHMGDDLWKEALSDKRPRSWLKGGSFIRPWLEHPSHVWSFHFVEAAAHESRRVRFMAVIDEFTLKSLTLKMALRINAIGVIDTLADATFLGCSDLHKI